MRKYDLAISFGDSCKSAFYLKIVGFRKFSSPFDWNPCPMVNQVKIYENNFLTFFENYEEDFSVKRINNNRVMHDKENNLYSLHFVRSDIPIDEAMSEFMAIMKRRYECLNSCILESSSILLVSCEDESINIMKECLLRFSDIYKNKKITLLNIVNNSKNFAKEEYIVNDNLDIIRYSIDDSYVPYLDERLFPRKDYEWIGNAKAWVEILSEFELND